MIMIFFSGNWISLGTISIRCAPQRDPVRHWARSVRNRHCSWSQFGAARPMAKTVRRSGRNEESMRWHRPFENYLGNRRMRHHGKRVQSLDGFNVRGCRFHQNVNRKRERKCDITRRSGDDSCHSRLSETNDAQNRFQTSWRSPHGAWSHRLDDFDQNNSGRWMASAASFPLWCFWTSGWHWEQSQGQPEIDAIKRSPHSFISLDVGFFIIFVNYIIRI